MVTALQKHFDGLFTDNEDPWNYRSSWNERRRLELLMSMLPDESYGSVFEPACANGSLTERLAPRAGRVLAWDGSSMAIDHARRHLSRYAHIRLDAKSVPEHWPEESFDLVVLSDFLYYLPEERIVEVATRAAKTVHPIGSIVACHWRGTAHDFRVPGGDAVHAVLCDVLGPPVAACVDDRNVIDVWTW